MTEREAQVSVRDGVDLSNLPWLAKSRQDRPTPNPSTNELGAGKRLGKSDYLTGSQGPHLEK